MHDKTIRRRRAVLLGLVAGSLLLLTAYFGESAGGGLHAVQRGVSDVLSPVQEGASRALKPVRDGVSWVGDTFDAKSENEKLKEELATARRLKIDAETTFRDNAELRRLLDMNKKVGITEMGLVPARVISRSPNVIDQVVKINKGRSDGVRTGQPVVTGDGLAGTVGEVGSNSSIVTLVTDADFGAGAKIAEKGIQGVVKPAAGAPRELRMEGVDASDDVRPGDTVVTSGTSDPEFPSPFPRNVDIGKVFAVEDPQSDSQVISVRPFVDVRDVNFVEVITQMDPGST